MSESKRARERLRVSEAKRVRERLREGETRGGRERMGSPSGGDTGVILWKTCPRTQETSRGTLPRPHKHAHHPALDLSAEQADESRGLRHAQPLLLAQPITTRRKRMERNDMVKERYTQALWLNKT